MVIGVEFRMKTSRSSRRIICYMLSRVVLWLDVEVELILTSDGAGELCVWRSVCDDWEMGMSLTHTWMGRKVDKYMGPSEVL